MAMVQCPECGKQISDKAAKCLYCGCEFVSNDKKTCVECGEELTEGETVCHVCGCPVDMVSTSPQQVEVTGVKISNKSKKIFIGIAVAVVVTVAAIAGIMQIQRQDAAKTFGENLELATITMLSGAGDAENCGNLIKQVWFNAIYEKLDSKTDQYTRPDGYFVDDFNTALQNLFSDASFSEEISTIKNNQSMVQSLMKELKDPPNEYEDAYEALLKFYDAYTNLVNLVTGPSGSLQTFSSNFNDADSKTLNNYKAMSLYLE